LPHEELNRVIKERDRISEERDILNTELQQLQAEANELLARYESEKREIRNYMMMQDQSLQYALNAYEHQKKYTHAILSKLNQRSLVLKDQNIVTMDKLISTSPSFKWETMFEDVESLLKGKGQGAQLPSPWTGLTAPWPAEPPIPAVHWDKDEFLARLQRHFASSISHDASASPTPGPLDSERAPKPEMNKASKPEMDKDERPKIVPEPEPYCSEPLNVDLDDKASKPEMDKDERPKIVPEPEPYSSEPVNVDLDGRPLPPGWTNEEHVCGPHFCKCSPDFYTCRPFLKQSMWRAT
jgi:hypothetical protein